MTLRARAPLSRVIRSPDVAGGLTAGMALGGLLFLLTSDVPSSSLLFAFMIALIVGAGPVGVRILVRGR